jgi:hypothetical protein
LHRKRRESKEVKNSRDKKIMLVKLIIQKKKKTTQKNQKNPKKPTRYRNNKKFSLLVKVLELFLMSNPGIGIQVGTLMWSHQVTGL